MVERKYNLKDVDGPGSLDNFYLGLKEIVGAQPVDEMFDSITYYLQTFKQVPQESVREYLDRELNVWEQLQEAVALTEGQDDTSTIEPLHDRLR